MCGRQRASMSQSVDAMAAEATSLLQGVDTGLALFCVFGVGAVCVILWQCVQLLQTGLAPPDAELPVASEAPAAPKAAKLPRAPSREKVAQRSWGRCDVVRMCCGGEAVECE